MASDPDPKRTLPGFAGLMEAWMAAWSPSSAEGGPVELAMRILDPRSWLGLGGAALEQPFETVLGLPRLADMPDLDRKLLHLTRSWLGVAQRSTEYQALVGQVWLAAYGDFLLGLQQGGELGKTPANGRALLDRWTMTVNERLLKAQRSDSFLAAQRRLLVDAQLGDLEGAEREAGAALTGAGRCGLEHLADERAVFEHVVMLGIAGGAVQDYAGDAAGVIQPHAEGHAALRELQSGMT